MRFHTIMILVGLLLATTISYGRWDEVNPQIREIRDFPGANRVLFDTVSVIYSPAGEEQTSGPLQWAANELALRIDAISPNNIHVNAPTGYISGLETNNDMFIFLCVWDTFALYIPKFNLEDSSRGGMCRTCPARERVNRARFDRITADRVEG